MKERLGCFLMIDWTLVPDFHVQTSALSVSGSEDPDDQNLNSTKKTFSSPHFECDLFIAHLINQIYNIWFIYVKCFWCFKLTLNSHRLLTIVDNLYLVVRHCL
jgi:hypothetical protein